MAKAGPLAGFLCILTGLAPGGVTGARAADLVVGGAGRPWESSGRTPGEVIDFVDRLARVTDASGATLFPVTDDPGDGWILPLRLRRDFNISRGILNRGGSVDVPTLPRDQKDAAELAGMLSGNHKVAFDRKFIAGRVILNNGIRIRLDLGARFGVERIVFYPRSSQAFPFANDFLRGYELYLNDGLPQNLFASGQPIFTSPAVRDPDNGESRVEIDIDAQFVQYMELRSISTLGFEIDEIEIYGTGFVPAARYESAVVDLGEPVVWGDLSWTEAVAGRPGDSRAEIRVRSGSDTTPDIYYRRVALGGGEFEELPTDDGGQALTREAYESLRANEQGAIRVDGDHWSQWELMSNGQFLELPAPRRYFQFRVDFESNALEAGRAIGDLAFEFERPPVDRMVAEIDPVEAEPGETTTFTLAVRVDNRSARPGFERFEIETPVQVQAVRSVAILDSTQRVLARAEFGPIDPGQLPLRSGGFEVAGVSADLLRLRLPRLADDGDVLEVVFDAAVFRYGTRFRGRAFTDDDTSIPLLTEPGDATSRIGTDRLLVRVSVGSSVAGRLVVRPRVLTPNGDGVNDEVDVVFDVLHLVRNTPVSVDVLDLAGRRLARLAHKELVSGRYAVPWDGRTAGGQLVDPGIYIVAVEVSADDKTERLATPVLVAY